MRMAQAGPLSPSRLFAFSFLPPQIVLDNLAIALCSVAARLRFLVLRTFRFNRFVLLFCHSLI